MVRVWVTVIPCNTWVISERFRDQLGTIKRYKYGLFTLLYYFTFTSVLCLMHYITAVTAMLAARLNYNTQRNVNNTRMYMSVII